jgi:threonine synthase
MKTYIFVPEHIPLAKLTQLQISSAKVLKINANYDEVFDLSLELGIKKGWYVRHSAVNPYLLEGKKTGAFEILVQNDYVVPDYVIVAVGDGTIISALYKGFWEFKELGLVDRIPRMIGVQAEGIPAIKNVFDKGRPYRPENIKGETMADSIEVGSPRDVIKACNYVEASNGYFITLSDEEMVQAIAELGKETGLLAEPAGAAPYGGLKKLINEKKIKESDTVCLVITGNVLKDISSVRGLVTTKSIPVEDVVKWIEE